MAGSDGSTIGVDFGTSTSLVAERIRSGQTEVWPLGRDEKWIPSVAAYDGGRFVVGEEADDFEVVVRSVKRAITDNRSIVWVGPEDGPLELAADQVIVAVLAEVVRRAKHRRPVTDRFRLGCPAMWSGAQRRRLLRLAAAAGLRLDLGRLIDEPVAAGMAWLTGRRARGATPVEGRVLVFDMGGGTLDVAVLDVRGADNRDVSVLAALGLAEAGDYLDSAIAEDLENLLAGAGVEVGRLDNPARARGRLRDAARAAKVALSTEESHPIALPRRTFTIPTLWYRRAQLEAVFAPLMDRAEQYVWAALRTARLTERLSGSTYDLMRLPHDELAKDITHVVVAGGMGRIPYVTRRLRELFPNASAIEACTPAPEEAVVIGLADSADYGRINMFRPGFDVVLDWDEGRQRRTLYEAYSPLYEQWQVARGGSDLCHRRTGLDITLPRSGEGWLRASSPGGEPVGAVLDGRLLDGFRVFLSEQKFDFKIYCDGRIRLTDGNGYYEGHVDGWQSIMGRDHDERVRGFDPEPEPDIEVEYPFRHDRN